MVRSVVRTADAVGVRYSAVEGCAAGASEKQTLGNNDEEEDPLGHASMIHSNTSHCTTPTPPSGLYLAQL